MTKLSQVGQCLIWLLSATQALGQISFTDKTNLLSNPNNHSGSPIAVCDMNGDGLDDIIRLDNARELNIEYQTTANGPFTGKKLDGLPSNSDKQWGICTGDIDNNGYPDILTGGYEDGVKIGMANGDGTDFSFQIFTDPAVFVQGVNFADINNDGWLDAFVCHDDGPSRIFGNNGDGTLTYQPMWINLSSYPASDNSGNYGSVWCDIDNDSDIDLYIAHCRQGINDPTDPRRINQLYLNNGDNTFTQDITNAHGLRNGAQSWTADFGDIDNDGDFDCFITNHDVSSQLFENDGTGHFTDITAAAGLLNAVQGLPIQGIFRDFDNDGFVDILVGGSFQYLFMNNHNKTFTTAGAVFNTNQMESYALGDFNTDGFQDIYGGYAFTFNDPTTRPDVLWMNNGNSNHFLGLRLRGYQSNRGGVGAKVVLHSDLGTQVREVRSGEGYGISNSLMVHFGLGQLTKVDSVVINWPSGVRDVIYEPKLDEYLNYGEGGCLVPNIVATITGPSVFCSGQSASVSGPDGYSYLWNSGDTTQVITVTSTGLYHVVVTDMDGCTAISNNINIIVDPIEVPTVFAEGDTVFCKGGSVLLSAPAASSYLWSNGETEASTTINASGYYTVTTQGLCEAFTSYPILVTVLDSEIPAITPDTVIAGTPATLEATGDEIHWFETATSPAPLFVGNPFVTPALQNDTTFWASNITTYDNPNQFVGMSAHIGSLLGSNTFQGGLVFDCFAPFKLAKVKVYTQKPGERKIDLKHPSLGIIQTKTVNIPSGTTVVDLGFDVPIGTDLLLTTDAAVNQVNFGTAGPQLRRSDQNVSYPYVIPGFVSIKNSTFDESRYFYFYNWEVDFNPYLCESERIPVLVTVKAASGASQFELEGAIHLYPNPSTGNLTIEWNADRAQIESIEIANGQGVTVKTWEVSNNSIGSGSMQANLSFLPKGIYWATITGKQGKTRQKIVLN